MEEICIQDPYAESVSITCFVVVVCAHHYPPDPPQPPCRARLYLKTLTLRQ